jgi:rubrerythrin
MSRLPASAPEKAGEAFAHINAVVSPTIDDLKLMVFLEASGLAAYNELAKSAPNEQVRGLLEANGREELAHAHRVAKVIKILTGEDFPPPAAEDNRYVGPMSRPLDRDLLNYLVTAEDNGNVLYQAWAENIGNAEAAALLRQNGEEELRHGERAKQAAELLPA